MVNLQQLGNEVVQIRSPQRTHIQGRYREGDIREHEIEGEQAVVIGEDLGRPNLGHEAPVPHAIQHGQCHRYARRRLAIHSQNPAPNRRSLCRAGFHQPKVRLQLVPPGIGDVGHRERILLRSLRKSGQRTMELQIDNPAPGLQLGRADPVGTRQAIGGGIRRLIRHRLGIEHTHHRTPVGILTDRTAVPLSIGQHLQILPDGNNLGRQLRDGRSHRGDLGATCARLKGQVGSLRRGIEAQHRAFRQCTQ